jgi:uncharacterized protein YcaQ
VKADRPKGTLRIDGSYLEHGIAAATVAAPVARELESMAKWLALEHKFVGARGNFSRALRIALQP